MFWNSKTPAIDPHVKQAQRVEARKAGEITATFTQLAQPWHIDDIVQQFNREVARGTYITFYPKLVTAELKSESALQRWWGESTDDYRLYKKDVETNAAFVSFKAALAEKGIACEVTEVEDRRTDGDSDHRYGGIVTMHLFSARHNPPRSAHWGHVECRGFVV